MKLDLSTWCLAAAVVAVACASSLYTSGREVDDAGNLTYVTYIPKDFVWRYSDGNVWPGGNWVAVNFDDSGWKTGRGYLATAGETMEEGVATFLAGGNPAYMTYYFRGAFEVEDASSVVNMSFNVDYDDAYAIYLNGQMVASSNLGCVWGNHLSVCGPYPHNSMIDTNGPTEPRLPRVDLDSNELKYMVNGRNVLAVAVKQGSTTSTDAAFMLTLYGWEHQQQPKGALTKILLSGGWATPMAVSLLAGGLAVVFYLMRRRRTAEGKYAVKKGHSYLLMEDEGGKLGYSLFTREMSKGKYSGLYITRGNPKEVEEEINDSRVKVMWLTGMGMSKEVEGSVNPSLLDISVVIEKFTSEHNNALIIFDGLQYLINKIGLETVLEFISNLKDRVSQRNAVLLLPVVRLALEPRELGLLETELNVLKPDGVYEPAKKMRTQKAPDSKEVSKDV